MHFSLHVCGRLLTAMLDDGQFPIGAALADAFENFRRMQLNFHGEAVSQEQADRLVACLVAHAGTREVIVQLDGVNDWILDRLLIEDIEASGLYDTSHGAGVLRDAWPAATHNKRVGYAGGLGPENIGKQIKPIVDAAGEEEVWIDMETKLRTHGRRGDVFDLEKCRTVLAAVTHFAIH